MEIKITTSRTGDTPISLGRVNVFLGANGTGKSKLLAELKENIPSILSDYQVLNIEGGRALQMFDSLELDRTNYNNYKTYEQTFRGYQSKRSGTLQSRLFDGLKTLEQLGEAAKIEHSDAVIAWQGANPTGLDSMPKRPIAPMDRVFESFTDIFPAISLNYSASERRLRCTKNGNRYGPTSLSEGEKQVFSVLVDVVELVDHKTVLFVDEPELNLHPSLANRLWGSIESMLPDAVFIYATHSVSFAMRDTVDSLLVLSDSDKNIQQLDGLDDLPMKDKEELLGNITSLLASKQTLLVEGEDESFDSIFYHWILKDGEISPSAVGSCEDVIAISERTGKWDQLSTNVKLVGIIDRDYKAESKITHIEAKGVHVLDLHEAESYLCQPNLLIKIAQSVGTVDQEPDEAELRNLIVTFANEQRLKVVARRVAAQLDVRLGVSVPAKPLSKITTEDQLKALLLADVKSQKQVVSKSYNEDTVAKLVDKEAENFDKALGAENVEELLKIIPGKELLNRLATRVGCVDANSVARAARHHLKLSTIPQMVKLRARLISAFNTSELDKIPDTAASGAEYREHEGNDA